MSDPQFDFISNKYVLKVLNNGLENHNIYSGINNGSSYEIKTNFEMAESETVINGRSNSLIVLGRDRDGGKASGFGGKGFTGAACVDIIAGHRGQWPIDTLFSQRVLSSKDFKNDASRLYLSQMSDVDTYFSIPKISAPLGQKKIELEHGPGVSTAALKADTVRVIARENIKLVTFHKGLISANVPIIKGGIDIMAGCDMMGVEKSLKLQPMVKGNNLVKLLKEMIARIDDVNAVLSKFMNKQKKINDILSKHTHQSNKAGLSTSSIIGKDSSIENFTLLTEVLPDVITSFIHNSSIDGDYFLPFSEKYINSIWNRVN